MTYAEQHSRTTPSTGGIPVKRTIEVGLDVVAVAIVDGEPLIAVTESQRDELSHLPGDRFDPALHPNFDNGLKGLFARLGGLEVSTVEQLSTAGVKDFVDASNRPALRAVSSKSEPFQIAIGYLGLIGGKAANSLDLANWRSWYDFLPWENRRGAAGDAFKKRAMPLLEDWSKAPDCAMDVSIERDRQARTRALFAVGGGRFDEERVMERYHLLKEANLVDAMSGALIERAEPQQHLNPGINGTHRELLTLGVQRLRSRLRHWPIVAGLMPAEFTLFELQRVYEGVLGSDLHKQNFRRFVETARVLEETGELRNHTGGRPAKLFRFTRDVLANTHGGQSQGWAEM